MAKVRVEVCMVSARGLRRSSSLWKRQWFAVGWIDPNSKYCSKIDSSGSSNPTWNTKFSTSVDVGSDVNDALQDLVLTVEVYRREPVFLGERLHGAATVALKEFVGKHGADGSGTDREVGSFQLRKKKSGKPRGFVDVSVRVSRQGAVDGDVAGQYPGSGFEELEHWDRRSGISLAIDDGPVVAYPSHARRPPGAGDYRNYNTTPSHPYRQEPQSYPSQLPEAPPGYPHNQRTPMSYPHTYQTPPADLAARNASPPLPGAGPHRRQGSTPPPPPPPSNTGFIPSLFPGMGRLPESYVNVPSTGRTARGAAPAGFVAGLGAGALAAGAVIFGDDFLAAPDFPAGFGGGGLALSAEPPF